MRIKILPIQLLTSLIIILIISMMLSINTGVIDIPIIDILSILIKNLGITSQSISNQSIIIVNDIRIPRTLLGLCIGSALAISGAVMQGLFRNPLADPSIIGISSGSALGATIGIYAGGWLFSQFPPIWQNYSISLLAFIGGLITTWLVFQLGTSSHGTSVSTMLLAGIAITAISGAILSIIIYISDNNMLRTVFFWQMGSLANASWQAVIVSISILIPLTILLCHYDTALNALLLGESEARHLGINVQLLKKKLIFITALIVGTSVSISGIIGFVGLVVPHFIRLLVGPNHRTLLKASALLGAILLILADIIARVVLRPAELPIGIVTALLGAPFFLSLIIKKQQIKGSI